MAMKIFLQESHTSTQPPSTDSYTAVSFALHGKLHLNQSRQDTLYMNMNFLTANKQQLLPDF